MKKRDSKKVQFTPELWWKWMAKRQLEENDAQTRTLREGIEEVRRKLK